MSSLRTWFFAAGVVVLLAPATRGQVAFIPIVESFPNGVNLSATPVVSADRRYVRLTMNPQFTVLEGFDPIQVPAAVSGGGGGLGGGGIAGLAGLNGPMAAPGQGMGMAGYGFGNPGAAAALGGVGNAPDFAAGDFEDQTWPQQGRGAVQSRMPARPVPTKAAKSRRARAEAQRKAAARSAKGTGLAARDRFSNSPSKSQKK